MNIYLYVHIVVIVVQYRNVVHQAGNQGSIVYILLWSRASKANLSLTLLTLLSFTIYAISFRILSYYAFSNFNIINIKLISKFTYTWLVHKLVFLSTSSAYIFVQEQDERHMHRFWSKQKKIFEYILHASFVTNFRWLISKERIYVNVIHCVRLYLNE